MSDIEHARMMLELARKDCKALGGMPDTDVFDNGIFGFHVQQAVEKTLKAWLASLGVEYPKTHDIRLLLTLLRNQGANTNSFIDLVEYNPYAVQLRYDEPYPGSDEPINREQALCSVRDLIAHVERISKP